MSTFDVNNFSHFVQESHAIAHNSNTINGDKELSSNLFWQIEECQQEMLN